MVDRTALSTCEAINSVFTSPVFCIYAGPAKQQFSAHAQLLVKSATLCKIVEGQWKDSNDRTVNLEEWDPSTVQQLLEWLYTGQYNATTMVEVNATNISTRDLHAPTTHAHVQANTELVNIDQGDNRHELEPSSVTNSSRPVSPLFNSASDCVAARAIGCTLMLHAKVYALAQYLQLGNLKHQALHNIKTVLSSIKVLEDKPLLLNYIVDLVRYTYSSTDSLVNSKEPLRDLVSTFAADWFEVFEGPHVDVLIAEGGDFVVDLMSGVRKNVQDLKKQVKKYQKRLIKRGGRV
ncbi:MAG: hypothetical protein Q9223_006655 [Gallowayella weberi]